MNGWTPGTVDLARILIDAPGNALVIGVGTVRASGEFWTLLEEGFLELGEINGKRQTVCLLPDRVQELKNLLNA